LMPASGCGAGGGLNSEAESNSEPFSAPVDATCAGDPSATPAPAKEEDGEWPVRAQLTNGRLVW
jgi:hypothetical protein